eukprot:2998010-Rhodomonas_salina.1
MTCTSEKPDTVPARTGRQSPKDDKAHLRAASLNFRHRIRGEQNGINPERKNSTAWPVTHHSIAQQ